MFPRVAATAAALLVCVLLSGCGSTDLLEPGCRDMRQQDCEALQSGCSWTGWSCQLDEGIRECSDIGDRRTCLTASRDNPLLLCGWAGERCLRSDAECGAMSSARLCNATWQNNFWRQCFWGGSECLGERYQCEDLTDEGVCGDKAPLCRWSDTGCHPDTYSCEKIGVEALCDEAPSCFWHEDRCIPDAAPAAPAMSVQV